MIDIDVSYNTRSMDGDFGETYAVLAVSKTVYRAMTGKDDDRDTQDTCTDWLEKALTAIEALRGREYMLHSIKDIRKVT